ncbi:hypothetical protein C8R45DRAFT_1221682 [Mycena sanguinolenta]|nr:hypothetical protein C8R45DRAFT_1221682 [Mycena sanguinolenta]
MPLHLESFPAQHPYSLVSQGRSSYSCAATEPSAALARLPPSARSVAPCMAARPTQRPRTRPTHDHKHDHAARRSSSAGDRPQRLRRSPATAAVSAKYLHPNTHVAICTAPRVVPAPKDPARVPPSRPHPHPPKYVPDATPLVSTPRRGTQEPYEPREHTVSARRARLLDSAPCSIPHRASPPPLSDTPLSRSSTRRRGTCEWKGEGEGVGVEGQAGETEGKVERRVGKEGGEGSREGGGGDGKEGDEGREEGKKKGGGGAGTGREVETGSRSVADLCVPSLEETGNRASSQPPLPTFSASPRLALSHSVLLPSTPRVASTTPSQEGRRYTERPGGRRHKQATSRGRPSSIDTDIAIDPTPCEHADHRLVVEREYDEHEAESSLSHVGTAPHPHLRATSPAPHRHISAGHRHLRSTSTSTGASPSRGRPHPGTVEGERRSSTSSAGTNTGWLRWKADGKKASIAWNFAES